MTKDQVLGYVEAVACQDIEESIRRIETLRRPTLHTMRSTEATQIALAASEMIGRLRREMALRNAIRPVHQQSLLK